MINSLTIKNFQSHKKTILEFDEGINVITGQSDSGKSAILRALGWVINNKPAGEEFRSTWGGDTKVKLKLEDRGEVLRYRTKKVPNGYQIHYSTKVKKKTGNVASTFRSFGQDVPDEIKELLNFSPLNMQGQFDSPFLLAMSGGEVARYLNKIVHLDVIDKSLSNIGKTLREEQQDLKRVEVSLKEDEEKAKTFYWIDKAEGCLVKLEQFQGNIQNKKDRNRKLGLLVQKLEGWEEEIEQVSQVTQHEDKVNKLIRAEKILKKNQNKVGRLDSIIDNIRQINNAITDIGGGVIGWEKDFKELMPDVCPLCGRGE